MLIAADSDCSGASPTLNCITLPWYALYDCLLTLTDETRACTLATYGISFFTTAGLGAAATASLRSKTERGRLNTDCREYGEMEEMGDMQEMSAAAIDRAAVHRNMVDATVRAEGCWEDCLSLLCLDNPVEVM